MSNKTALLPTVTAVRMVWAMTGKFSDDEVSQRLALYVEDNLKQIEDRSQDAATSQADKAYVLAAVATMKASLRSLDVIHKGRTLNFAENEKLRAAYLESVKESLDFGSKMQDFLRSLPTMTITAAGGVTLAQWLELSDINLWLAGIALAGAGYLLNLYFVRRSRAQTQMLYVTQDYERGLYYQQYLARLRVVMLGLLLDLERIHQRLFGENYEPNIEASQLERIINDILSGVGSTFCPFVHKHIVEKKVTPEIWARCESGNQAAIELCPFWEGVKSKPASS